MSFRWCQKHNRVMLIWSVSHGSCIPQFLASIGSAVAASAATANMPVVIQTSYSITIDDSPVWKLSPELVKTVGEQPFLKLRSFEPNLIRLICHNHIDLPKNNRYSLNQVDGWQALMKLRNDAAFGSAGASGDTSSSPIMASLFGASAKPPKKQQKPARMKATELQQLRNNPTPFEWEVPGVDAAPSLMVTSLKPAHPGDDLWLLLDNSNIQHVIEFVRSEGVDIDALLNRRVYGHGDSQGGWRMGSAGIVMKIPEADDDAESPAVKKYKTIAGKRGIDHAPPLEDGVVDAPDACESDQSGSGYHED